MKRIIIFFLVLVNYYTVFCQNSTDTGMKARLLDSVFIEGVYVRSTYSYIPKYDDKAEKVFGDSKVLFRFIPFYRNGANVISSARELLKIPDQEDGYIYATYRDWDLTNGIKEIVDDEVSGFSIVDTLISKATPIEVYDYNFYRFVFVKVVFYKYLYFNKNLGYLSDYVYPDILATRKSYVVYYPKRLLNAKEISSFPMQIPFWCPGPTVC